MSTEQSSSVASGTSAEATSSHLEMKRYINLADYAYTSGLTPFSHELETKLHIKPLTTANGKIVEHLVNGTGFYGEAFVTTGSGPKQVIIAYEGTNIPTAPTPEFAAAQLKDDYEIFKGGKAASYSTALRFTRWATRVAEGDQVSGSAITLDGHSLGAADAEYVASKTGLGGVTFGTPGVSTALTGPDSTSKLTNYVDQGDPVGNYAANAPRYLGQIVQSDRIRHYGNTVLTGDVYHSYLLQGAADAYAEHSALGDTIAVAALGYAASQYHLLGNYADDLGLKLYGPDRTTGSDVGFFDSINPFGRFLGAHGDFGRQLSENALDRSSGAVDHAANGHGMGDQPTGHLPAYVTSGWRG